ncbi:MAG: translation elongation factor Ts [Mariprofundus sp.]|nr:translation elongation factor Ts [Mariprofundus sp.]
MSQITAADVKKLREMTGAGMMDCKKALGETAGDIDAAVDFLRKKGLSAASKKAGRVAAEGVVVALTENNVGVVLEVNSETDFVSKNDQFIAFVNKLAALIISENPQDVAALKAVAFDDVFTVEQALSQLIATIGENMSIRRFERAAVDAGTVVTYVHGGGKIGVLCALDKPVEATLARGVAMHIAAANPQFIGRGDVDSASVERERAVLTDRALASGKPAAIVEKIVTGQMSKFYSEVCLLEQHFVLDTDKTVKKALADATVVVMTRFQLGDGIEKKEEDFAAEVAAQIKGN